MTTILHRITMEVSPQKLYTALTTQSGLSAWWTKTETNGETVGTKNRFFFGQEGHAIDMQIKSLIPNQQVSWQCVDGPWQEMGLFNFVITPNEKGAVLSFSHQGWPDTNEFFQHCNAKWGFFLVVSLKSYLETGTGQPHPKEPSI